MRKRDLFLINILTTFWASHLGHPNSSDTATQEAMFAAIERYLNTFDTNSGKLEAAHNLIKKLKMVANELQQESIS